MDVFMCHISLTRFVVERPASLRDASFEFELPGRDAETRQPVSVRISAQITSGAGAVHDPQSQQQQPAGHLRDVPEDIALTEAEFGNPHLDVPHAAPTTGTKATEAKDGKHDSAAGFDTPGPRSHQHQHHSRGVFTMLHALL